MFTPNGLSTSAAGFSGLVFQLFYIFLFTPLILNRRQVCPEGREWLKEAVPHRLQQDYPRLCEQRCWREKVHGLRNNHRCHCTTHLQGKKLACQFLCRVFIKYCVFSKNFQYFVTSPSPALGCYWLYGKWPANRSECTIISQIR